MLPIESELTQALYDGDLSRVKALVESGADLRYRYEGYDALIDAVHGRDVLVDPGLINMLRWLIDRGVELNTVTRHDESALRVLSRIGRFDAVRLLLEAGADEAQLTWSPLIKAVALGTLEDVHALLGQPTELEARDFWSRTAWLVALQLADVEKAKLLRLHGVDPRALGRCGQPPLFYAIDSRHAPMLEWLLSLSEFDVEQTDEFGTTALIHAVEVDALELVNLLLGAGADLARVYNGGTALSSGQTLPIVTTLLGAGADPKRLSTRGRRLLIGLPAEPELTALDSVTQPEFLRARTRRYGSTNPEVMNEPFWLAMIRSGVSGYEASTKLSGASSFGGPPTWCAYRFGQSLTRLADGRVIQIGGEHEDHYDPDFCIYNDVFLHGPDGALQILGYPEHEFPPTDFHTATLLGERLYVVGSLGYRGRRKFGQTQVCHFEVKTGRMQLLQTAGESPGWLFGHRATAISSHEIRVSGGEVLVSEEAKASANADEFILDVERLSWRRA